HPRQLPVIERAYLPTPEEVDEAREIVAATGRGALALPDGRFVDAAVVEGARRTLALAARAG
ncbi:CoA ester lyase, partial [Streptomyces sp. SID2131]|nr:CoA ester lyase [Streptomyces sp. SID2131]